MKISKVPSTVRGLLLAFSGVVLNFDPALAAEPPYDAQAQLRAVIAGVPRDYSSRSDQSSAPLDSRDSGSPIELQVLVRQFILATPSSDATRAAAAALHATTTSPAVGSAALDGRRYAEVQRQVQRTLQGGAG